MAMRRWVLPCCLCLATARWLDYEESGATPVSSSAAAQNTELLNAMLASLHAGDTLFVPNKTFWLAGGVLLQNARNVTLHLDGTLEFLPGRAGWPEQEGDICNLNPLQPARAKRCVKEAIFIANVSKLTLTSTSGGTLNGHGKSWWGYLQYFFHGENRPRLLSIYNGTDILVEKWNFVDSAYWTFTALDVARMEIRHCTVSARVDKSDDHDLGNMDALNTDGFDVAGRDIHIHHCSVWNQDDCFTVQPRDRTGINADCTENVLVEHVNASGLGLTIGAVRPTPGHNCVRNVTFRDAYMLHTFKGIYLKSQNSPIDGVSGEISNVLYEDIVMDRPSQVPIWIGPAQEADSYKACSLLWPEVPFAGCSPPGASMLWANITLRNVRVLNPKQSPGLVYGNPDRPMQNIHFENVVTVNPGLRPWGRSYYKCEGVAGLATAGTQPAPPCFRQPEPVEEVGLLDYLFA